MLKAFVFQIFVFALILLNTSISAQDGEAEARIVDRIFKNYSNTARPPGKGPTAVTINMYVRGIDSIDDANREFNVQLSFRMEWNDNRLVYDSNQLRRSYLTLTQSRRVWLPDLFFRNERRGHLHDIVYPNVFLRIFPRGNVMYSLRLTLTLTCPMDLRKFPFDAPNCTIQMASYGMTTDDIVFEWKKQEPVQFSKAVDMAKYSLVRNVTEKCDSRTTTGVYSCLRLDLIFKRIFSSYLIHIYIPCTSLVIAAWLSFWLDATQVVARVQLTVGIYLVMMLGVGLQNFNIPATSYTKAVDVWTGVCLTFVFAALIETIIIGFLQGRADRRRITTTASGGPTEIKETNLQSSLCNKVDIACRILYPALFVTFIGIYFTGYKISSSS